MKLEKCLFNFTHHIQPEEFQEHLRICPDRILVETYRYTTEGEASKPAPVQPAESYTPEQLAAGWGEENWDDMDEKPYDPEKYCLENRVIRKARLMTKSERREFYLREAERHDELAKKAAMAASTQEPGTSKPKNPPKKK